MRKTHCNTTQHNATHCNTLQHAEDTVRQCDCVSERVCEKKRKRMGMYERANETRAKTETDALECVRARDRKSSIFGALENNADASKRWLASFCS